MTQGVRCEGQILGVQGTMTNRRVLVRRLFPVGVGGGVLPRGSQSSRHDLSRPKRPGVSRWWWHAVHSLVATYPMKRPETPFMIR